MFQKSKQSIWFSSIGFIGLFLVSFISLYLTGGNERLVIPLLLFKIMGFYSSLILVFGSVQAPFFDRFCPKSEKFNCNLALDSPGAKVLGIIHASDLGVIYFAGGIILIMFMVADPSFYYYIYILAWLNLCSLPYTLFSVLYQAFVLKKWCALCLIVQLILWLEFSQFFEFLFTPDKIPALSWHAVYPVIMSFGIPLFVWYPIRSLINEKYQDKPTPEG